MGAIVSDLIKPHPVLKFNTYEEAEKVAKEISKQELRGLSIVKRYNGKKFIIATNVKRDRKSHDIHIMRVQNFESPYLIFSYSSKSGQHEEGFPTQKMADQRYKQLLEEKYRTKIYKKYPDENI